MAANTTLAKKEEAMNNLKKIVVGMLIGGMSAFACAGDKMAKSEQSEVAPAPDKALVIFMRSSIVVGAYSAPVIDADVKTIVNGETKTEDKMVGILSMYSKVAYQAEPGEHTFISTAGSGRIAKANLIAGKTYYILVRPNWGMSPSFSLRPLRADPTAEVCLDSPDFESWLKTSFYEPTEEALSWMKENRDSIIEKKTDLLRKWETLPNEEKVALTLLPTDVK